MQGAQTESRFRGIGRYSMNFVEAVIRNRGEHEVILALNGSLHQSIEPIRNAFEGLLSQENIRVWHSPIPHNNREPDNDTRREIAELIREAFLASLQPDVIHICSYFEGFPANPDDAKAVISIGKFDKNSMVSVTIYDFIPLVYSDVYLKGEPKFEHFYIQRIENLKRANIYLAISDSSMHECLKYTNVEASSVFNTSMAIDAKFKPLSITKKNVDAFRKKFNITRSIILYSGGSDERKNLPRLIKAYAALPRKLRLRYQLIFAGRMPHDQIIELEHIAEQANLEKVEFSCIGFVTDDELIYFYNLCELYVFPSWHEGFGLPVLEAMSCGAPVICSNATSLQEIVDLDEAMFDPLEVKSIKNKMHQALIDKDLQKRLRKNGQRRVKLFSWDKTAKKAIASWTTISTSHQVNYLEASSKDKLLYDALTPNLAALSDANLAEVSNCLALNQQAGIERQLLLDISELCQHDAATGVQRVVRSYLKCLLQSPPVGFRVEPVYATTHEIGYRYARNFTQRFLGLNNTDVSDELIRWQRGDIFFGLDMQHHVQLEHRSFYQQLQKEGVTVKFVVYDLLPIQFPHLFPNSNIKQLHEQWLSMIAKTDGAICISKTTSDTLTQWIKDIDLSVAPTFQSKWVHIGADIEGSHPSQGLPPDADNTLALIRTRLTFICVSTLEPRKGQQQILDAFEQLWAHGTDVNLVFVGKQGWKVEVLAKRIRKHPEQGARLFWLQDISDEYLKKVYVASTCLIAASINEGFGLPMIEAAQHGIPIIARDIPVFREVAGNSAFYFGGGTPEHLAKALQTWLRMHAQEQHPRSQTIRYYSWQQSAEKLKDALVGKDYSRRQLLVDLSAVVMHDSKSGIQRVVKSILKEWLTHPPEGYRVEPVYATMEHSYLYARHFTADFMNLPIIGLADEPIDLAPGDMFFGLDFNPDVQGAQKSFYKHLRRQGVGVRFLVHDILPISKQQFFRPIDTKRHIRWLDVVADSDGAVCVSHTVANDLTSWVKINHPKRSIPFKVNWNHNGADISHMPQIKPLSVDDQVNFSRLNDCTNFLMVGTIEIRKGHTQVLDAFELLWHQDVDINLVLVGNEGWLVDDLSKRLRNHSELNKRLFWFEGISDECLEKIYTISTCLIAASYDEGFGLPLIEAAQNRLPIIARDIPVFREVAGEHAHYFIAESPTELKYCLEQWLALYKTDQHPQSVNMPWLTWKESANQLLQILTLIEPIESTSNNVKLKHQK